MNRVCLSGNLTANPVLSEVNGKPFCSFTIAVNRPKKNDGNSNADFIDINAWDERATACGKHLFKGRGVAIDGKLRSDSYTDKDDVKHYKMYVVADQVDFLGSPSRKSDEETPTP